jgi:hypothetical protein
MGTGEADGAGLAAADGMGETAAVTATLGAGEAAADGAGEARPLGAGEAAADAPGEAGGCDPPGEAEGAAFEGGSGSRRASASVRMRMYCFAPEVVRLTSPVRPCAARTSWTASGLGAPSRKWIYQIVPPV